MSVTVTLSLGSATITTLDTGAAAYATLEGAQVAASTPAAQLIPGSVDPELLSSTPDANASDPYIQELAAELGYNAQNIFNFLHNSITYNAYTGSVRGARGTLWAEAGNALDVASLGVALMHASGIPAQYVEGTLSFTQAQQLVSSMFPSSDQTVGYIPSGTQTSDPESDGQLLSETENHFWLEFDTGSGWVSADPLMPGAAVGQSFTTPTGTFTEVPDAMRETTEITLTAEIYSQAAEALVFGSNGLTQTVVLDQTFDDVQLVGHPLTTGNFVSQSAVGSLYTFVTNTYSPYIQIGDAAQLDPGQDVVLQGTAYQEVLSSFPLASQVLTGLFLDVILSGPQEAPETYEHTIYDSIGIAARESNTPISISVNLSGAPALTDFDLTTFEVSAAPSSPSVYVRDSAAAATAIGNLIQQGQSLFAATSTESLTSAEILITRYDLENFNAVSALTTANLASLPGVIAYFDRPRITILSIDPTLAVDADLLDDQINAIATPGEPADAAQAFQMDRGFMENAIETQAILVSAQGEVISAATVFQLAGQQGISTIEITAGNLSALSAIGAPASAITLITNEVMNGDVALVPEVPPLLNGQAVFAWYDINPTTGETVGMLRHFSPIPTRRSSRGKPFWA